MHAALYRTRPYKIFAMSLRALSPAAWPFFVDRVRRKLTGNPLRSFSPEQAEETYGRHVEELDTALRAMGLMETVRDPRVLHSDLFENGWQRIAELRVPFRQLGLAGQPDIRLLYSVAAGLGARDILETGVALGWSSLALLKVAEATRGRVVSVELPYPFLIGDSWVGAVVPDELRENWTVLKQADRIGIPKALSLSEGYDFIHYDSDKSPEGRKWAYPRLWEALRPGGVLISDDVGDNEAWAEFCAKVDRPLIVVRRQRGLSGLARKPVPRRMQLSA